MARVPPPADRRHATRVLLGLLVPGLVLLAMGRRELILYAVLGSFAGMYGRGERPAERLRHQLHGAGMLVTGVALGTTLAATGAGPGVLVGCVTAFATLGSLVTDALRLRPGGPFFGIFALGATASVGAELVSPLGAVLICAATAGWCLGLGIVGAALVTTCSDLYPGVRAGHNTRVVVRTRSYKQALRYALATATAGLTGLALGIEHANWAMAAAAVPLAIVTAGDPIDLRAVVERAGHRIAGTFAGLAVTAVVLLPEPRPAVLALVVMALLFPTELFLSRHHGVALGFFTPLIMIMTELAAPTEPLGLLVARGADTLLGVAAGVAAAALVPGRER